MKHIVKTVPLKVPVDLTTLAPDGVPLFMDIETTGLSPERNHVYLIGCCYPLTSDPASAEGLWEFHQWFSESPAEEAVILTEFRDFLQPFSTMFHFNGDTFDLPFLHRRAEKNHVAEDFMNRPGVDLLKRCRKLKRLLATPDARLKTLEAFLGLVREDRYTGGELIEVYRNYVKKPDPEAAHLLLLHNEEDILGMPELLPILIYHLLLNGAFHVIEVVNTETAAADGTETFSADLLLDLTFPQPVFFREDEWHGIIRRNILHLSCETVQEEMKLFFPNYRDYYYLPAEDMAMHKSVAEFVDKNHRQKATKETAYIRHVGTFLPVPGKTLDEVRHFRTECKGRQYVEMSEENTGSVEFWDAFAHLLAARLI